MSTLPYTSTTDPRKYLIIISFWMERGLIQTHYTHPCEIVWIKIRGRKKKGDVSSSLYNNANTFECLPCAEGCDSCKDASPCVAALNWPMRTSILALACAVIGFLPPAAWFTFRYQQVKVSAILNDLDVDVDEDFCLF